jgi:hypothetical protein
MIATLKNELQSPLQLFLKGYLKTAKENLNRLEAYVKSVGNINLTALELSEPDTVGKLYEPLRDECEKVYDSIIDFYKKLKSFIEKSVQEISGSEGATRAGIAKQILYSMEKIEKQNILEPTENVEKQINETMERAARKLDSEITSVKDSINLGLKLAPSFIKHSNGVLEEPVLAARSCKLPPIEDFFEGGYPELLHAYSSIVLGLGVPENIVQRAVSQLRRQKALSSVIKPLMKVKEANTQVVTMHLSEYVRMFIENVFSLLAQHVDQRYAKIEFDSPVSVGVVPVELMEEPVDYLGKPAGIEWSKDENLWTFKMHLPGRESGNSGSIERRINKLLMRLVQEKHGNEFEAMIGAGKLLSPEIGLRVERGIQRLMQSLSGSVSSSNLA